MTLSKFLNSYVITVQKVMRAKHLLKLNIFYIKNRKN